MTSTSGTSTGKYIHQELTKTPNLDSIRSGQSVALSSLENAEDAYLKLLSIGSGDEAKLKKFAQEQGLEEMKDEKGKFDKGAMATYFQTVIERASRVFMAGQKLGDRMHDMMMEVIRSLGRV